MGAIKLIALIFIYITIPSYSFFSFREESPFFFHLFLQCQKTLTQNLNFRKKHEDIFPSSLLFVQYKYRLE